MTHTQTTCPNRIAVRASKKRTRPAEVGSLDPLCEKSATELKLKQKLLIGPRAPKSLNSIEKIPLRMMIATFNGDPSATIISSNVSEETDPIDFYNELSSLVRSILKHNVLVIGGVMNAQIGKNINHKFSLHNSSNRNEEHLTDFTLENRLTSLTIKFQKKRANYGPILTQIILKHRYSTYFK